MQTKLWKLETKRDQAIAEAAALIRKGEVVAFPTETVYGLGANGLDGMACRKIFAAKGRPADNPLILHIAEKEDMEALTKGLSPMAQALMEAFWPGPMTLIVPKSDKIPDVVTAGLDTVAVRFPSHPVARDLIRAAGCPIAAPSANKSGKPSPTTAQDVLLDMDGIIAGVLDGGACDIGVESTIIDTTGKDPVILRPGGITREMIKMAMAAWPWTQGLSKREHQGTGHEVSALCPDRSHASCGRTGSFFGPHPPCHHGRSPWSSDRCHCLEGDGGPFPQGRQFCHP